MIRRDLNEDEKRPYLRVISAKELCEGLIVGKLEVDYAYLSKDFELLGESHNAMKEELIELKGRQGTSCYSSWHSC